MSERDWDYVIKVDPGDDVLCDICNADYTDSPDCGGYILSGYAVCPGCALSMSKKTKEYGEAPPEAVCPDGVSFADFVRAYR